MAKSGMGRLLVQRCEPVLVAPARPTPHELKVLSEIDDQLKFQVPMIQYYRNEPKKRGQDPARVIREALAKALVFYYPVAGRLREGAGGKLMVECTGDGVLFVEADANVSLEQFGDALPPPVPCLEEFLCDVPGSGHITGCLLILIQVTRLTCGGFILALRFNHTIFDGLGLSQFLTAMAEIAQGVPAPSVPPVWARHLLSARSPPLVTHTLREYDSESEPDSMPSPWAHPSNMVGRSFFFGPKDISALRAHLPELLRSSSSFEVLTACIWRSRTAALCLGPVDDEVRFMYSINSRTKAIPPLPKGYYGNAIVCPALLAKASELCSRPLGYALELVKKGKREATDGYINSVADLMALSGRPPVAKLGDRRTYMVSDIRKIGLGEVDYGWGKAAYGGIAIGGYEVLPGLISFITSFRNGMGEEGAVVPICLPGDMMDRFVMEVEGLIGAPLREPHKGGLAFISSVGN